MTQGSTPGLSVEIVKLEKITNEKIPPEFMGGYSYTIKIGNFSDKTVKLLGRKWMIKQFDGLIDTVEADGVVGEQPVISQGESYTYTSFCLLKGKTGSMWGFYFGKDDDETPVLWTIPKFDMSLEE